LENGFARLALSGGYFVAAPMGLTVLLRDSVFFLFPQLTHDHLIPTLLFSTSLQTRNLVFSSMVDFFAIRQRLSAG
jgi:hypothetical protein